MPTISDAMAFFRDGDCMAALSTAGKASKQDRLGHRQFLRETAALAYGVSFRIKDDKEQLRKLANTEQWQLNYRDAPKEICTLIGVCLEIAENANTPALRKQSQKRARVLNLLASRSVLPEDVADEIERGGGFEKLAREAAKINQSAEGDLKRETPATDEGLDPDEVKAIMAIAKKAALDCNSEQEVIMLKAKHSRLVTLVAMGENEEAVVVIRGGNRAGDFRPLRLVSAKFRKRKKD